jgi:hypothetical protein
MPTRAKASAVLALINRIETVATKLEELYHCIHGNGSPGLQNEMIEIKAQIKLVVWLAGGGLGVIVLQFILRMFHIGG